MPVNFLPNNPYNKFLNQAGIKLSSTDSPVENTKSDSSLQFLEYQTSFTPTNTKKKLFGIIGISAGSILLLGVIFLSALTKGFSGGIARHLKKISETSRKKIYELSSREKVLNKKQKLQLKISKIAKYSSEALQASANITAIKDGLTQHWLNNMKLKKVTDKINEVFKKISLKTKTNAYQNAEISLVEFCNAMEEIISNKTGSKYYPELKEKINKLLECYYENFATKKHIERSELVWKKLENLHADVCDVLFKPKGGFFKNMKNYKTYVTTDLSGKQTNPVFQKIIQAKRMMSNSLTDIQNETKEELFKLKIMLNAENNGAIAKAKEIARLLETNKILKGADEQNLRRELYQTLNQKLSELEEISKDDFISADTKQMFASQIQKFRNLLNQNTYQKGLLQEILTDIKNMLRSDEITEKECKDLRKLAAKVNNNLNNALKSEDIAYEKLAELRVGSASTDIIGILAPTALATFFVINSKNKKERISNTLTKGIPILGGVAISYYGTTRGFTGLKNLVIGAVTGVLLNALGHETDVFVKKHRKEQEKLKKAFEAFTKMQKNLEKPTI